MPSGFQFREYDDRGSNIGALMMAPAQARARALREAGAAQARAAEVSGQATAGAINNIGNIISGGIQQYAQHQADAPRREAEALQLQGMKDQRAAAEAEAKQSAALRELFSRPDPPKQEDIFAIVGPERGLKIVEGLSALQDTGLKRFKSQQEVIAATLAGLDALPEANRAEVYAPIRQNLLSRGLIQPDDAPEQYDPAWFQQARNFGKEPKQPGTRQVEVVNPDGTKTIKIVQDTPGQEFTSAQPKEKLTYGAPTEALVNGRRAFVRPGSDGAMYSDTGQKLPAGSVRPIAPQAQSEPLEAVMGPRGPILVPRSQAVGRTPASSREQGRPVTSGDAGRIADFDTALDDLSVLGDTLTETKGATGTRAKVGAVLPKAITDITGWGTDAKKRQAVIDRVKQVIGKALEGGVLRKEDEYKYEKILPTIGDTADVAASKLSGLGAAITQRRSRQIDALEDAGYDVAQYRARQTVPPAVKQALSSVGTGQHTLSDGSVWEKDAAGNLRRIK